MAIPIAPRRRLLAFTSLGHFINDGSTFLVPLLAAILAARQGVSALAVAVVLAVFYASAAVGAPFVGAMADRYGPPTRWIGPGLVLLTMVVFLRSIATQALVAWVPIEITLSRGTGITASLGVALTGMFAAAIVGRPVFGLLADRFPRRALLAVSTAGFGLAFLGYLASNGGVAYLLLAVFGFCTFSAFPLLMSLAGDYVPRGSSSRANSLVFGVGSSGGVWWARSSSGRSSSGRSSVRATTGSAASSPRWRSWPS